MEIYLTFANFFNEFSLAKYSPILLIFLLSSYLLLFKNFLHQVMQFSISNFSKSGSKSQPKSQPVGQIHSLDFYPFKGCRPIKLQQAILTNLGIQDPVSGILDRSFMIYRPDTNKMVSTKFLNKLAVLTCEIIPHPENPKLYGLKIFFDEYENQPASTPLDIFPPEFLDPFIISNINICGKPGEAIDCGDEASQYVTSWINKRDKNQNLVEHRVVFFDPRICVSG